MHARRRDERRRELPSDDTQGTGIALLRVRWIEDGWRRLDPVETPALACCTTPARSWESGTCTTCAGHLDLLTSHEREHVATATGGHGGDAAGRPRHRSPLLRQDVARVTIALMDEPLRTALGMPRQPVRLGPRCATGGRPERVPPALKS